MKTYEIKFTVNLSENVDDELRVEILHKLMFEMAGEIDFVNQVMYENGYNEFIDFVVADSIVEEGTNTNLFNVDTFFGNRFNEV